MKTYIIFFLPCFAFAAHGQQSVENISPKELTERIEHEVLVNKSAEARRRIIDDVIASERLDLLSACFFSGHAFWDTKLKVAALPKSTFRARATITLLRSPSGFWPEDGPVGFVGFDSSAPDHLLVEPFTSTMAELLPEVKFEVPLVRLRADRIKLADRLEAALQKKFPAASPPPAVPPVPSETLEVKPVPKVQPVGPKSQPSEASPKTAKEPEDGSGIPLWLPIAAVAAFGLWMLIRKK